MSEKMRCLFFDIVFSANAPHGAILPGLHLTHLRSEPLRSHRDRVARTIQEGWVIFAASLRRGATVLRFRRVFDGLQESSKLARFFCAGIALGAAGCASGSVSQLAPFATHPGAIAALSHNSDGWLLPLAKSGKGLVYLSDNNGNAVYIFDKKNLAQGPIGEITDAIVQPNGLAVDRRGRLYVANSNNTVTVYPRGSTTPSITYTNGISLPFGLVVSPDTGRLYVANLNANDVTEYPKGSTIPDTTISFVQLEGNDPFGMALDRKDYLFVSALGYPTARAYEVPSGSDTPQDLGISGIEVMHGIAVDLNGNVIVVDQKGRAIYVYPPGSDKPSKKITDGLLQPILIALNKRERRLYVADAGYDGYDGGLWAYSYPRGKLLAQVHLPGFTVPEGVAITPL
jgi:DNA-binding beta-propeller fold protein YncE